MPRNTSSTTRTFVKDGKERVAYSPGDAVALVFDGWVEKTEPTAAPSRGSDSAPAQKPSASGSSK